MIKIPELAKELGMDQKTLVFKLKDAGYPVNSPKSKLDDEMVNYARENFAKKSKKGKKVEDRQKNVPQTKEDNVLYYTDALTIEDVAATVKVPTTQIIKDLMMLGIMANKNQVLDRETLEVVVSEYGFSVKDEIITDINRYDEFEIVDDEASLVERPPVITIMGHVDHGKTTLLDTIRSSRVVEGEFGGITQHIGAYQVTRNGKLLTFIDTPGHAAFSEMRARGAQVTDIVIIVVAADDGVMPQTKEAVDHAKASGVPIIIAVNKMDKPQANPDRVMAELAELGLIPEAWGGDTIYCNISALTGLGIDDLLENVLAVAEMAELKANPTRLAIGTVIEARLDKAVGPVATLLVQNGSMRLRDVLVVGETWGRVRTMKNDLGRSIAEALPSTPVEISGLAEVPKAGDKFMIFSDEKEARRVAELRKHNLWENEKGVGQVVSLENLFDSLQDGSIKQLNVIVKCDVQGSVEAIKGTLGAIDIEGAKINIIRCSVGTITETDVTFAVASNAIIIGFNVRPSQDVRKMAQDQGVDIRLHNIIYTIADEITQAMKGMLEPVFVEKVIGQADVREIFKASKIGTIAGCFITDGLVERNSLCRLIRDGIVIYTGKLSSLKRMKDDVKEVNRGYECGMTIENYNDIKQGDVIEFYKMVEEE